jgi:REP element-mobilizing transposase RayT
MDSQHSQKSHQSNSNSNRLVSGFHSRGTLPHYKQEGAIYFVTFRLADTLPREVLLRLKNERETILRQTAGEGSSLARKQRKELFKWYAEKVDAWLDAGKVDCWLQRPEIAILVVDTLKYFEGVRYNLHAWVVMPNHVHVVVRPIEPYTLSAILASWKTFIARRANQIMGRSGEAFWQRESYDHCCRDEEDLLHCSEYTLNNPVKAQLCERIEDWRWSSAFVAQTSSLPVKGASGPA